VFCCFVRSKKKSAPVQRPDVHQNSTRCVVFLFFVVKFLILSSSLQNREIFFPRVQTVVFLQPKNPSQAIFLAISFFLKKEKNNCTNLRDSYNNKKIVVVSTKQQSCLLQKNFIMMYKKTSTRFLCLSYNLAFAQHNQKRKKCVKTFVLWVLLLIEQCQRIEIIQLHLVSDKERTPSQITKNIYSQDFLQTTKKSGGLSSV